MERAGGLNEQHRQGGLSYFPDTTSNAAKESQKDTKETSSSKGNNDTIRGVAMYIKRRGIICTSIVMTVKVDCDLSSNQIILTLSKVHMFR